MFHTTPQDYRIKKYKKLFPDARHNILKKESEENVLIKKIDSFQVIFVRHVGDYDKILETWLTLATEVGLANITSPVAKKISIFHDSPEITPPGKLRYDACVSLDVLPEFKAGGKAGIQTIYGGKYAVISHRGPLNQIELTYEKLFGSWLPNSGYEPDDRPNFILHHDTPLDFDVNSSHADIYLPIR